MNQKTIKVFLFESIFIVLAFLPEIYSVIPSISLVLLIILAGISVKGFYYSKLSKVTVCWLFYVLVTFWGCFYSDDFSYAIGHVLKVILLTSTLSFKTDEIDIKRIFIFIQIIVFLSILSIVLELPFESTIKSIREAIIVDKSSIDIIEEVISAYSSMYGIFADTAVAAFFCAYGFGLFWFMYFLKYKKIALLWIILSSFAIYLTNKRGPLLSIIVSFTIVFIVYINAGKGNKILNISLFLLTILSTILLFQSNQFDSYYDRINSNTFSTQTRDYLYRDLLNGFLDKPLFGHGTKSTRYFFEGLDAHNIYLGILFENGVLGFVALVLAFYASLKSTYQALSKAVASNNKQIMSVCFFCLFCELYFVLYGMTGIPMTTIYTLSMFFYCVGLSNRFYNVNDSKQLSTNSSLVSTV